MKQLFTGAHSADSSAPLAACREAGRRPVLAALLLLFFFTCSGRNEAIAEPESSELMLKFFELTEGRLAYTQIQGESRSISVIDFGTLEVRPLIATGIGEENPEYSPDGRKIAYDADMKGAKQIYVADADGTNQKRLTNGPASNESPSWSPDGTKILYQSTRQGGSDLVMMNADGSKPVVLIKNSNRNFTPRLSPRGDELLFASNADWPGYDVFVQDMNSKKILGLTKGGGSFLNPVWHPFGGGFVFSHAEGANAALWYAERGSADGIRISPPGAGRYVDPCFTKDGKLLFAVHENTPGKGDYQLEVSKLKTEPDGKLTAGPFTLVAPLKGVVRHPSFTPYPSIDTLAERLARRRVVSPPVPDSVTVSKEPPVPTSSPTPLLSPTATPTVKDTRS